MKRLAVRAARVTGNVARQLRPLAPVVGVGLLEACSEGLVTAVEVARPSVVQVQATRQTTALESSGRSSPKLVAEWGVGVIVDPAGLIVTATRFARDVTGLGVRLDNELLLPAEVLGTLGDSGLALLRVEAADLPAAAPAEGDLRMGQLVIALGPGPGRSVAATLGVISGIGYAARGRNGELLEGLLLTDAARSRGLAGTPLLDPQGSVVAILTEAVATASGLGYAVPAQVVWRGARMIAAGRTRPARAGEGSQPNARLAS